MSSIIAHALIGASICSNIRTQKAKQLYSYWLIGGILAISPDFDYIIYWLTGHKGNIRYTHTIFYCLCEWLLLYLLLLLPERRLLTTLPAALLLLSSLSHLMLDWLVGVNPIPLFWPLIDEQYRISIGILPSAGYLSIFNYYFWRNLLIEMGIIVPLTFLIIPHNRRKLCNTPWLVKVIYLFVITIFLLWSICLER
jgi:membrane-bound metal-dependent hydrolase YbcI (DUF457 family)